MTLLCGIDEAGRGPIIGPLVICGVVIEENKQEELLKLGVKDSKLLTPKQREHIAIILKKTYKYHLIEISPSEIDASVNNGNLNWLEADKAAHIINALKPEKAIMDCPSPNIKAYTAYLRERLTNKNTTLTCAHHADRDHPIVGAASIIAKVQRDYLINELKKELSTNFGSGYMADPTTATFLKKNWNKHPEIFRHSWAPYQKIIKELGQGKLNNY